MTVYALWYFKPLGGNYAIFDTNVPTSELSDLGFDYMIALHAPGKDGEYGQMPMSGYSYDDGYNDGKNLAQWTEREVNPGLPYLVEIPVLVKDDKEQWILFENSNYTIKPAVRMRNYWLGWIDGIYTHTGGLQRGFYWNLEYPWQVVKGVVSESAIRELSDKILGWGQQFIWIPYAHEGINLEYTDIKVISKYFTHVFAQPNYYQEKTTDFDEWYYLFKSFRDGHNLDNLYMEMECDGGVKNSETLKERACEYTQYAKNFPHRAYYYGTDIANLEIMEGYCHARGKNYIF